MAVLLEPVVLENKDPLPKAAKSALNSNTTGGTNTAVGYQALLSNTTADNNTAVGYTAMYTNTTGQGSTALGRRAMYFNTTGSDNTAVGNQALYANTTGANNASFGDNSMNANTTGFQNTAIGTNAGGNLTTGNRNTLLGAYAGQYGGGNLATGNGSTLLGHGAIASGASVNGELVIFAPGRDASATAKGTGTGFLIAQTSGGTANGMFQGNNSSSWSTTSDRRLKKNIVDNTIGLSAINAIQVRNFEYRTKDEVTELEPQNAIEIAGVQIGAIAQEIQAILPECVKTESTGVMSVDTTNLTWYLINAVKELNAKVEAQALEIATLKGN